MQATPYDSLFSSHPMEHLVFSCISLDGCAKLTLSFLFGKLTLVESSLAHGSNREGMKLGERGGYEQKINNAARP